MAISIVVGYDGSRPGRQALDFAIDAAKRNRAELHVVIACGPHGVPFDFWGTVQTHKAEMEEAAHGHVVEAIEEAKAQHLSVRTHVLYDHPASAILTTAEDVDARFIVVASHGGGHFTEGLFGSTTHKLLARSLVPVVVVPVRGDDQSP